MRNNLEVEYYHCYSLSNTIRSYTIVNGILYGTNLRLNKYLIFGFLFPIIGIVGTINYERINLKLYCIFLLVNLIINNIELYYHHNSIYILISVLNNYSTLINVIMLNKLLYRLRNLSYEEKNGLINWLPKSNIRCWGELREPLIGDDEL